MELNDRFWSELLPMIEEGNVIPVIGQSVITMAPDDRPLYPWLAETLAENLELPESERFADMGLNDVVTAYHLRTAIHRNPNAPYPQISTILKEKAPTPGTLLQSIASIRDFNLFLTTTIDPLLEMALNDSRFAGESRTSSASFLRREDLPVRNKDLFAPLVYHIFGKASSMPGQSVLWSGDALEAVISLHDELSGGTSVNNLSNDLSDHSLLMIGLSFSDWLVRFFMRVTRQKPMNEPVAPAYFADKTKDEKDTSLVMFFGAVTTGVNVVKCCPREFVVELADRWHKRNPDASLPATTNLQPVALEMPRGAVFISYAREDEEAVLRLVKGLQKGGVDVWYDRERLKPGVYWAVELEEEVKNRCSLFLSVVSKTTENTPESYYHKERNWAMERFSAFAGGTATDEFYLPVVIDESSCSTKNEPLVFRKAQATRLPGGNVTPDFASYVKVLQEKRRAAIQFS